jgi:hypothetical protein
LDISQPIRKIPKPEIRSIVIVARL